MFGIKGWVKEQIKQSLYGLKSDVQEINNKLEKGSGIMTKLVREKVDSESLVKCETCKCLLYEKDAHQGKSKIVRNSPENRTSMLMSIFYGSHSYEEKVQQIFYCQAHKPVQPRSEDKPKKGN